MIISGIHARTLVATLETMMIRKYRSILFINLAIFFQAEKEVVTVKQRVTLLVSQQPNPSFQPGA